MNNIEFKDGEFYIGGSKVSDDTPVTITTGELKQLIINCNAQVNIR